MHTAVSNQSCYEHSVKMSRSWAKIVGVNSFWKQNLRNDIAKNRKAFFFLPAKISRLTTNTKWYPQWCESLKPNFVGGVSVSGVSYDRKTKILKITGLFENWRDKIRKHNVFSILTVIWFKWCKLRLIGKIQILTFWPKDGAATLSLLIYLNYTIGHDNIPNYIF